MNTTLNARIRSLLFLFPATLCLWSTFTHAAGFSTIEIPADAQGPALRAAVWTPCAAPAGEIALDRFTLPGVRDCPVQGDRLPLVVVSHGYGGSFLGHRDTAQALADAGFVVAAVTHSGDNYQLRGSANDSLSALATRTTDIKRLIDYMLGQWPAHARLSVERIGFYGFSRGGYTGLVLAGGIPEFERLPIPPSSPCATAPEGDACAHVRRGFRQLLATPLTHDRRIRAAVIADPLSMVFDARGLRDVTIPIQLWSSAFGGDGVTPESVLAVRRNLPSAPDWRMAENAAHFGFLAPCPAAQIASQPEICRDPVGFDRVAFHASFNAQVLAFFSQQLAPTSTP